MSRSEKKRVIFLILLCVALSRALMYLLFGICHGSWNCGLFIQKMNIWDSGWYRMIAEGLYPTQANDALTGQASWAFFPAFPLMVHMIWKMTSIDVNYIAVVLNAFFLCMALYVGCQYIFLTRGNVRQGIGYIYFMTFGAYSFYFSIFYTESLYLFLLTCAYYFMCKGEYLKMGIAGALLSLTRNTGVFFCFVILVHWIKKYQKKQDRNIAGWIKKTVKQDTLVLGTMMVPLGFFSYMTYLKYKTGDAFAFLHVQKAWGRENVGVWKVAKDALFMEFPPSYLGIYFCIFIYLLIVLMWKNKRTEEAILPAITLSVAASSSLMSTPRYMVGSFTMILAFTDEWKECTRLNKALICVAAFIFELACVHAWLNGSSLLV